MTDPHSETPPVSAVNPARLRHRPWEDALAIVIGTAFVALSLVMFRHSQMLTGGTTGLAFVLHYLSHWPLGAILFIINLPFYLFAWLALGRLFTLKTFAAVGLLSALAELMPVLLRLEQLNPWYSALMSGLLAGTGILILIRHGASLGGIGVLAIYLQRQRGWRAGTVQMVFDSGVLALGLWFLPWTAVAFSVLSAMALNLVIAVNHRPDRYFGF